MVGLLIEGNDVDLNAIDDHVLSFAPHIHSRTPLMIAMENGHEAVVRLLLGKDKVDINIPNGSDTVVECSVEWKLCDGATADREG
jgi:hypothetical protein